MPKQLDFEKCEEQPTNTHKKFKDALLQSFELFIEELEVMNKDAAQLATLGWIA